MTNYLLDINIASQLIKGDIPLVNSKLASVGMDQIAISVITEAELRYGPAFMATDLWWNQPVPLVSKLCGATEFARKYQGKQSDCLSPAHCSIPKIASLSPAPHRQAI
ncbi:MAG: hypothetical protein ACRYGK_10595 [Janthinobacterium lividum]